MQMLFVKGKSPGSSTQPSQELVRKDERWLFGRWDSTQAIRRMAEFEVIPRPCLRPTYDVRVEDLC
jgi:hypothetical protein